MNCCSLLYPSIGRELASNRQNLITFDFSSLLQQSHKYIPNSGRVSILVSRPCVTDWLDSFTLVLQMLQLLGEEGKNRTELMTSTHAVFCHFFGWGEGEGGQVELVRKKVTFILNAFGSRRSNIELQFSKTRVWPEKGLASLWSDGTRSNLTLWIHTFKARNWLSSFGSHSFGWNTLSRGSRVDEKCVF